MVACTGRPSDHGRDLKIARSFARGEVWARDEVCRAIHALAVRGPTREDIEDIKQDLCVGLMSKPWLLDAYQGERPLAHYFARCLKNRACDRHRRRARGPKSLLPGDRPKERIGDDMGEVRGFGRIFWETLNGDFIDSQRTGRPRGIAALARSGLLEDLCLALAFLREIVAGRGHGPKAPVAPRLERLGIAGIATFAGRDRLGRVEDVLEAITRITFQLRSHPGLPSRAIECCRGIEAEVRSLRQSIGRIAVSPAA